MNKDQRLLAEAYEQVLNETWLDKQGKRDNEIPPNIDVVPDGTNILMKGHNYTGMTGIIIGSTWLPHMQKVVYDVRLEDGKIIYMVTGFNFEVVNNNIKEEDDKEETDEEREERKENEPEDIHEPPPRKVVRGPYARLAWQNDPRLRSKYGGSFEKYINDVE